MAIKETTLSPPTETIDPGEIVKAFRLIKERLDAQDQVLLQLQQQPQSQTSPGQYQYLNAPALAGQEFPVQSGGDRISGQDILKLIGPFIQPQDPMQALMSTFFESTIKSAMDNQLAMGQIFTGIAKRIVEKEAGVTPPRMKHDHKVSHRGLEAQA